MALVKADAYGAAGLRGLANHVDDYAIDSAATEAMRTRLKSARPLLLSPKTPETVAGLENVKMWATAAEGWLRVPKDGFLLLRALLGCLQHKEKSVHSLAVEILVDVSSTLLGARMMLSPSKFDNSLEVQRVAMEHDRHEVQTLLANACTLIQQTTGTPKGRQVVYGLIKMLENLLQVPGCYEHVANMPDFNSLFSRLLNLHGQTLNDLQITVIAGRLVKAIFKNLRPLILTHPRFTITLMDLTKTVRRGVGAVSPDGAGGEEKRSIRQRRLGVAAAVAAAEEAKEDLVVKMAKVEEYREFVAQYEESEYVDERRKAMHYRELIADALREAEEAASILLLKEKKAEKMVAGDKDKVDSDKVQAAIAAADDAAALLSWIAADHQGRMQVLTLHPNLRMLFGALTDALFEGIAPSAGKVIESLTHPSDSAKWLLHSAGLQFEADDRSRLVKLDIVPLIAGMLSSEHIIAQRTSLFALMNLFRTSHYMEPLHPAGELVKSILPKLRDCLFSADRELAMYAARMINRLTGVGEAGGPQRAVLVSGKAVGEGGDAEVFLEALCVLLLSAENEYDIANITVTLCIFLCNEEVSETLNNILKPAPLPEVEEVSAIGKMLGYVAAPLPKSEEGEPIDNDKLSGLLRRCLLKAMLSGVTAASAAAAESLLTIASVPQWRKWLLSGRGDTSPTKMVDALFTLTGVLLQNFEDSDEEKEEEKEEVPASAPSAPPPVAKPAATPAAPPAKLAAPWYSYLFGTPAVTTPAAPAPTTAKPAPAPEPTPAPTSTPPPAPAVTTAAEATPAGTAAAVAPEVAPTPAPAPQAASPTVPEVAPEVASLVASVVEGLVIGSAATPVPAPAADAEEQVVAGKGWGALNAEEHSAEQQEPEGQKSSLPSGILQALARMPTNKPSPPPAAREPDPERFTPPSLALGEQLKSPPVSRADMLSSWVGTVGQNVVTCPDFGEAPEEISEEMALPVVWTGPCWMQFGAAGVIGNVVREFSEDAEVVKRLSQQDDQVGVCVMYTKGLMGLMFTQLGAKHAAVAMHTLTKRPHGLIWLSCLGPAGVDNLLEGLARVEARCANATVVDLVKAARKRLQAAKPPAPSAKK